MLKRLFPSHSRRACFLIFGWTLVLRMAYLALVFDEKNLLRSLPFNFDKIARMIVKGELHPLPSAWGSYPIILAGFYKLLDQLYLFSDRIYLVAVLNCLTAAASSVLFYLIACTVFPNRRSFSLFLAFCFSLYYPSIYLGALVLSENLFTPILMALFLSIIRTRTLTYRQGALIGALSGFGLILRPILGLFIPLCLLWLWRNSRESVSRKVLFSVSFGAVLAFITLGTAFLNRTIDSHQNLSIASNGGLNFAISWCHSRKISYRLRDGERWWFSPPAFLNADPLSDIASDVPFSDQSYYYSLGFECLRQSPERIFQNLKHIANVFSSKFYPNLITHPLHQFLLVVWRCTAIFLLIAFFLYPLKSDSGNKEWGLSMLLLVSLIVSVYLSNPGEERYLTPYFFVLLLFGAKTIANIFDRNSLSLTRREGVLAALTVTALLATLSYSQYQNSNIPLRISPRYTPVLPERAQTETAFKLAADWLVQNQRADGAFVYLRSIETHQPLGGEMITRQLLSMQGLANAAKYFNTPDLLDAHRRNIRYIESLIHTAEAGSYIKGGADWLPINETAFAILTLVDSPFVAEHKNNLEALGAFILFMQEESGKFLMRYPKDQNLSLSAGGNLNLERFASGEAALACIALYQLFQDKRYLHCAEKAFKHYYPRIAKTPDASFASWHTIAYSQLFSVDPREEYRSAVFSMAEILRSIQNGEQDAGKIPGGFDGSSPIFTAAEAVYAEALGYAARTEETINPHDRQVTAESNPRPCFAYSNRLAIYNLLRHQLRNYSAPSLKGGIRSDYSGSAIRVDNVGHALMAFYEYLTRESAGQSEACADAALAK